ncbi:tRNA (adenine37-N(6))-methyltransferase TrmN6 [hydrothermal vent metagenome]|uniref:tRNA (Adenine37-N(6))-methyltransferase TrmN6 n=1 Tax=hydrothermal vent metagenome TaxID=652676 RepID=A0A1W1BBR1_9ZZZZ
MFLYQPTSGYCYNSDSIFLYHFIKSFKPKGRVLDVGCGVGILSLLVSRDFDVDISIIDKQEKMLSYAKLNFDINNLTSYSYLGDFLSFDISEKFDMIISNPPFYGVGSTQSRDQHLSIARYASHLPLDKFVKKVKSLLKPRGRFIFCYDAKQIDDILYELKSNKINPEVLRFVHSKIDRESKLVMVSARMNSLSVTKILPPLVVFDSDSSYLTEANLAFDTASTHSIKGDF